jgi:hypothetical protein
VDLKLDTQHKLIGGSFAAGLAMNTGANTITATWATVTNDIPLMLQKVSAGFEQAVGEPLRHVFCNYSVWNNVLQNTLVRQLAGTAATPFAEWRLTGMKAPDGSSARLAVGPDQGPRLDRVARQLARPGDLRRVVVRDVHQGHPGRLLPVLRSSRTTG